jgi:hypothetical protein
VATWTITIACRLTTGSNATNSRCPNCTPDRQDRALALRHGDLEWLPFLTIPESSAHVALHPAPTISRSSRTTKGPDMIGRKLAAAVVVTGALLVGVPSVAGATPGSSTGKSTKVCTVARRRVPVLEGRTSKLQAQLTASQNALGRAQQAGKQALVNRLTARVQNLQLALTKVQTTLTKVHQTCDRT